MTDIRTSWKKPSPMPHLRPLQVMSALLLTVAMLVFASAPAAAHDPIFFSADQTTPDTGPYMPDGSVSWALYGTVLSDGDTRGFEFDLRDGDDLVISLQIPNLAPEMDIATEGLPYLELESPDGSVRTISANMREVFDEPFSRTSYLTLYEENGPGEAGRYRGIVHGIEPARFSVAIGINEVFFTEANETERSGDRPSSFAEITVPLTAWYTTPPGEAVGTQELAEGEAEIDLELIEEAMEDGIASAPEEALASNDTIEEEPAEPDSESGSAETATAPVDADGDGSSGLALAAPIGIGVIALLGVGWAMANRKRA